MNHTNFSSSTFIDLTNENEDELEWYFPGVVEEEPPLNLSIIDEEIAIQLQREEEQRFEIEKETKATPALEHEQHDLKIQDLFVQFDHMYFHNSLASVSVDWSKRMTMCAGICRYEGRGGLCSVSLSEPLLKFRPKEDLVNTLLHEMIHAYLFVTVSNRDRNGHGPEFQRMMNTINKAAKTNITIYHNFSDEVDYYRDHWWRCDGPCVKRKPFFGIVKRSMNRAPGPSDYWWKAHQSECGGTFKKIKEPENYGEKKRKRETKEGADHSKKPKIEIGNGAKQPSILPFFKPNNQPTIEDKPQKRTNNKSDNHKNTNNKSNQINNNSKKAGIVDDGDDVYSDNEVSLKRKKSSNSMETNNTDDNTPDNDENVKKKMSKCPVCEKLVRENDINVHLDSCLSTV